MNVLVTGANGQLGNEMRLVSKKGDDRYVFTDVVAPDGLPTTILDITDIDAAIGLWVIELIALVLEDGGFGENGKAMGKATRDEEL